MHKFYIFHMLVEKKISELKILAASSRAQKKYSTEFTEFSFLLEAAKIFYLSKNDHV
jgi:hypothetical protein